MTKGSNDNIEKMDYKGEYLIYTLTQIDKGIVIGFIKNAKINEVSVVQKEIGHTSMDDYYKFGDILTYNELNELKSLVHRVESLVAKSKFSK